MALKLPGPFTIGVRAGAVGFILVVEVKMAQRVVCVATPCGQRGLVEWSAIIVEI